MIFSSLKENKIEEASAYSTASLPTEIDLNPSTVTEIRNYYSSLNSLSNSERQGNNLLKNLKEILKDGQRYFNYDSGDTVWRMYEIIDRDWEKSPASAISSYNSTTNIIENYSYKSTDPYIRALYINRDVNNQTTAWSDHQQTQWGINREHVWPKAEGFDTSGAGGARGDPMHLMAGNGYSNNIHSNYYYGYVKTSSSYTDVGDTYSNQKGNLRGTSKTLNSGTVFEPQDSDKGDIARAIFYMVARYNYLSGSDSDGINSNNPNLQLTQNLSDWASSGYTSSTTTTGKMGILTDLLAWHHADPVDQYEIRRNNLLYKNFTNNRNPFIDFPEWVDFIWGTASYTGSTYNSYSSTPTGVATPKSDTINGYNSGGDTPTIIDVTGVSLNKNAISLEVGATETLVATVTPNDASDQSVTWTSGDDSVATVSHGTVTATGSGNTTITVTTNDGGFTATCTVTVTSSGGGGGGGQGGDTETASTTIGDYATEHSWSNDTKYTTVNLDSVATASVSNGSSNTGKYYTNGSNWRFYQGESAAIDISVASGYELDSVTFTYTVSNSGTLLDSSNNTVASGTAKSLSGSSATFHVSNSGSATNSQVRFTAISVTYHSSGPTLSSITINTDNVQKDFTVGDEFNYTGLVVTAHYSDDSTMNVVPTSVSTPDMSTTGTKTVTVTYHEETATYQISVNDPIPTSITAVAAEISYYVGETLHKSDITVTNDLSETITDFDFDDYTFRYEDSSPDGAYALKELPVSYDDPTYGLFETEVSVLVLRRAPAESEVTDVITRTVTGVTGNSYTAFSGKTDESNAVYAGQCAGGNSSVQLRSTADKSGEYSGIITTSSGGNVTSVVVDWNSNTSDDRVLQVYGSSTPYSSANELYSNVTWGTLLGTITKGTSTTLNVTSGNYPYIGIRSASNAIYLNSISITYGGLTVTSLADYIMYSDDEGQCTTKLDIAIEYFEALSKADRAAFMTSSSYVIATARERFEAWALNQGKSIVYSSGDYSISGMAMFDIISYSKQDNIIVVLVAATSSVSLVAFFLFITKKKKR